MNDLTLFFRNHTINNYNNLHNYNIDLDNTLFEHQGWRKFHCDMDFLRPFPDRGDMTLDQATVSVQYNCLSILIAIDLPWPT